MSVRQSKDEKWKVRGVTRWEVSVGWKSAEGSWRRYRKVFSTRRQAEAHERRVQVQVAGGTFGLEVKRAPTVEGFAKRYLTDSALHNKPSTVAAKEIALRVHLLPALGHLRLDAVELRAEVEAFKAKAVKQRKAKSVNNDLAVLGKLLSRAVEWGLVQHVPKLPKLRREKPAFDFLTFEESDQLLTAADPVWKCWLLLLVRTGLRVGEALALQWEDVDLVAGRLTVRRTLWNGQLGTPKNGKLRVIPLTPSVVSALKAHRHLRSPFVFCCEDKGEWKHLTHSRVAEVVPQACRRAGLAKRLTSHSLRHTFASHLVMRGTPLLVVKELLGHADLSMVLRYAHLEPCITRDAVQVLDRGAK